MRDAPGFQVGDPIECGEALGQVGQSGNALNPHLHFEVRLGPAGIQLKSMAHYDASASAEEMSNYCTWRVRGVFQLVDPMLLLR
jgi:murein DD-endopeptidase MepM/ murein hydrolase activator NlpD